MENQEIGAPDGGPIGIIHSPDSASSGLVWLVHRASDSAHTPVEERLLLGISGAIIRAAIAAEESRPDIEYGDSFFATHLYAYILAERTTHVRGIPKVSRGRLLKNLRRKNLAAAADIRSTVKTLESTACVDDKGTIEGFAWSLLFPKLSSHSHPSITARNPLMQSFKRAVITDWVHAWQRGDVSSLGDILYRLEPRFADLAGLSPHDARQAYPAWLAYALRQGAICTGNTACNIAASCLKRPLSDVECNRLKLLYGPTPLAGGANIYFLRRIIDRNKDVRSLMCEILSGLPREEYEEKFKRLVNLVTASFLVLMHLREVDGRAKRLDAAVNELEADTVEAVGLLAPPEVVENAEEFGRISAIISTLPQQDQTLIFELASSLKPKEIVERHPDWQLDNKQVSDRFRALCQKIRERS